MLVGECCNHKVLGLMLSDARWVVVSNFTGMVSTKLYNITVVK